MTSAHSQTIEARGGTGSASSQIGTGGRLRLAVAVAAVLALVAWSALDGGPTVDRSGLQANQQLAAPEAPPLFDGRGKWGGY